MTVMLAAETDDAYGAARIRAARSRLIQREQYDRLLRMSDPEVLNYLQSSSYRQDVESLGVKDLDDLEAIDRVIARHEDRTLITLTKIANNASASIVEAIRRENDAWNVRVAAESVVGGTDVTSALESFARPGTIPILIFSAAHSLSDLARIASQRFRLLRDAPSDLAGFLDALERAHAKDPLPEGMIGRGFADERNLSRALRCMREHISVDVALSGMTRGGTISHDTLRRVIAAKDLTEGLRILRETRYRGAVERTLADGKDMGVRVENDIHTAVLRSLAAATRADPLGPSVLARYVADIGIESTNVRLLVKAKRLGLDESFVRDRLVVP